MSWIEELYKTYENCKDMDDSIVPPYHMLNNTQIEIILSADGSLIDANREELKNTIIPCTEKSEAARTNNPPPHPLCDKIQFVAEDYKGNKRSFFIKYEKQLRDWANSDSSHPIVQAVYNYVRKGQVMHDLRSLGKVIIKPDEEPADLFVRWKVELYDENEPRCWKNRSLYESWQKFCETQDSIDGICMITGKVKTLALKHPKRIRHARDGGKIISSNDKSGFTFRGRFTTDVFIIRGKKEEVAIQSFSISSDVSQKAHRALRWLIERQGFRNGEQVIVAWAVSGKVIPDPFADTMTIFRALDDDTILPTSENLISDVGQTFAKNLSKKIAGYSSKLTSADKIIIIGLDSVGPGRISITFYRELTGSEFLIKIENWHNDFAWQFRSFMEGDKMGYDYLVYAPSPKTIVEACYGKKVDDKLKKSAIERLLPCIIDGKQLPFDMVNTAVMRASKRMGLEKWIWEQLLSVACALYTGYNIRESKYYINKTGKIMALEDERTDRDYLYGRLLAIAEHLEEVALNVTNEKRETTAARLMQRFADFPFSTWRTIELSLIPYKSRLQVNRLAFLKKMKNLMDEIHSKFESEDYEKDDRLSGAYLLGYHCQRLSLRYKENIEHQEVIDY